MNGLSDEIIDRLISAVESSQPEQTLAALQDEFPDEANEISRWARSWFATSWMERSLDDTPCGKLHTTPHADHESYLKVAMLRSQELTREALTARLTDCGLLAPEEIHRAMTRNDTPTDALRMLVDQGVLTEWQAHAVTADRSPPVRIAGYRILGPLGSGGHADVYRAVHSEMGREAALKLLPPESAASPDRVRRFRREWRAVSRLDHPGIVKAFDAGEHERRLFLAMELIEGADLRETVLSGGPLPESRVLPIICQAAAAVETAHAAGLIHRDIKPSNLLLTENGDVKLADFGLVRFTNSASDGETKTADGTVLGTPAFMAPEQQAGHEATPTSDVYSLAAVCFFLRTGMTPTDAVRNGMISSRSPNAAELQTAASFSRPTAEILANALASDPFSRTATVQQFRNSLLGDVDGPAPNLPFSRTAGTVTAGLIAAGFCVAGLILLLRRDDSLLGDFNRSDLVSLPTPAESHSALASPAAADRANPTEFSDPVMAEISLDSIRIVDGQTADQWPGILLNPPRASGVSRWNVFPKQPSVPAQTVACGPTGSRTAIAYGRLVAVCSAETLELQHLIPDHRSEVHMLAWSPDGNRLLTADRSRTAYVTSLSTGVTRRLMVASSSISAAAWRADGRTIVLGSFGNVVLASLDDDTVITSRHPSGEVIQLCALADGSVLAATDNGILTQFDASLKVVNETDIGSPLIGCGVMARPGSDPVIVTAASTGEVALRTLSGRRTAGRNVSATPGRLLVPSHGNRIALLSETGEAIVLNSDLTEELTFRLEAGTSGDFSCDPGGRIIAAARPDATPMILNFDGRVIAESAVPKRLSSFAAGVRNQIAAGSETGDLTILHSVPDGFRAQELANPLKARVTALAIAADGSLTAATSPNGLFRFTHSAAEPRRVDGPEFEVTRLVAMNDNRVLAAGSDGFGICDTDGTFLPMYERPISAQSVAYLEDRNSVLFRDTTLRSWQTAHCGTGEVSDFAAVTFKASVARLSPNGTHVAIGGNALGIYTTDGKGDFFPNQLSAMLAWHPDNVHLAAASRSSAPTSLIDSRSGRCIPLLNEPALSLEWTGGGELVAMINEQRLAVLSGPDLSRMTTIDRFADEWTIIEHTSRSPDPEMLRHVVTLTEYEDGRRALTEGYNPP